MAQPTDDPSRLFTTAGYAFKLLRDEDVDVAAFLQRIIDDTSYRNEVATIAGRSQRYVLPEHIAPVKIRNVLRGAFGIPRWGELTDDDQALLDRYGSTNGLRDLTQPLKNRDLGILIARYCLDDSSTTNAMRTFEDVGKIFGFSTSNASQRINRIHDRMRYAHLREVRQLRLSQIDSVDHTYPVEDIGLNDRIVYCLKRAQINTLGELLARKPNDLLSLTNFGESSLKDVEEQLRSMGLALAGS